MKIAHSVIVTPRRSGLYETTRELVKAIRDEGHDARMVDPKPHPEAGFTGPEDRGAPLADFEWAVQADLVVSHSGYAGTPLDETDQPIIHVIHGRPLSTFIRERGGAKNIYGWQLREAKNPRSLAVVTFWPEHVPYLENLWGDVPVHQIPPCVDLDYWSPGTSDYDFGGKKGGYNVVMTDPWARQDVAPFSCIHAFIKFAKEVPGAKLHIFAAQDGTAGFEPMFQVLRESGNLGIVHGWKTDLREVYRAADMLITPHSIFTRAVREAAACGVRVVMGEADDATSFAGRMSGYNEFSFHAREWAVAMFPPSGAATAFLNVAEQAVLQKLEPLPAGCLVPGDDELVAMAGA